MRTRLFSRENRKWWTLVAVAVGLFMIMLDNTVVNVALPSIQRDLGFSASGLAWVVERIARVIIRPTAERGLAAQLDGLALPTAGFLAGYDEPADLLRGPVRRLR